MRAVNVAAVVAMIPLVTGAARGDFLLTNGNAAFNPGTTGDPWAAGLSNNTNPYNWSIVGAATNAEGSMYTDVPGAFTGALGDSPIRAYRWAFRNAGGNNGGTAGKGLSGTATPAAFIVQDFTAGSNTGSIQWVDASESDRARVDAKITYTLTDGAAAKESWVAVVATFKNRASTTETYDFMNIVDSQILGLGTGGNDSASTSLAGNTHTIGFADNIAALPYSVFFTALDPTYWELNTAANIGTKTFSGAGAAPTNLAGGGGSTAGTVVGSGDLCGAFQWRVTLAPGATVTLRSWIGVNTIPAPAAAALLGLGGLGGLCRGRRR